MPPSQIELHNTTTSTVVQLAAEEAAVESVAEATPVEDWIPTEEAQIRRAEGVSGDGASNGGVSGRGGGRHGERRWGSVPAGGGGGRRASRTKPPCRPRAPSAAPSSQAPYEPHPRPPNAHSRRRLGLWELLRRCPHPTINPRRLLVLRGSKSAGISSSSLGALFVDPSMPIGVLFSSPVDLFLHLHNETFFHLFV